MTSNKEDYLKVIYEENGLERPVSNKVICEKLGIAPSSVTEMLSKLQKQGFIEYEAYKGSKLTSIGGVICIKLLRSHRLWEVFLIRYLGYSWREAHEDAHLLEHVAPERMIDRLEAFLNFPETCPHGSIIPKNGELFENTQLVKMTDLKVGDIALLVRVEEDGDLLDYLERSGIIIGEYIKIKEKEEYEGSVEVLQKEKSIRISYKAACQIYVEKRR